MAAIHFDSQSVKKQAKLLEEAADQIQNQTVKVITAANEAVAASWWIVTTPSPARRVCRLSIMFCWA